AVVRAVERLVGADGDAVGPVGELALAPRAQELARAVVDDDRMIAAADQEDAILRVDGHARDVAVLVPRRQLLPAWDVLVAQRRRLHAASPPRRRRPRAPPRHGSRPEYGSGAAPSQAAEDGASLTMDGMTSAANRSIEAPASASPMSPNIIR